MDTGSQYKMGEREGSCEEISPSFASDRLERKSTGGPRLACPFYKRDARKYRGSRSCIGPGFPTTARLKEHLYRIHSQPAITCPRCSIPLPTPEKLDEHLRAKESCPPRAPKRNEGIDDIQQRKLRKKKSSKKSDTEKWAEIYMIIFPDAPSIPSPYYDADLELSSERNVDNDWGITPFGKDQTELLQCYAQEKETGNPRGDFADEFAAQVRLSLGKSWANSEHGPKEQDLGTILAEVHTVVAQYFRKFNLESNGCSNSRTASDHSSDTPRTISPAPESWQVSLDSLDDAGWGFSNLNGVSCMGEFSDGGFLFETL